MDKIKLPGHGTLVDDNGNTLGRITDLVIEGVTPTEPSDPLNIEADHGVPGEITGTITFPEDLGNRRFVELINRNAVYGKMGGKQRVSITALPSGGMMVNGSTDALREYITRDIEFTEELKKRAEIDHIIAEALAMQRRGRPAPLPRPTYLAVAIRAIYDDIESWSRP